jgi:hypothetical protein
MCTCSFQIILSQYIYTYIFSPFAFKLKFLYQICQILSFFIDVKFTSHKMNRLNLDIHSAVHPAPLLSSETVFLFLMQLGFELRALSFLGRYHTSSLPKYFHHPQKEPPPSTEQWILIFLSHQALVTTTVFCLCGLPVWDISHNFNLTV